MEQIPETGGGVSGFLAHYLWMVYRYFPSSGRYDWLILFVGLALLVNFMFLPYLWRSVKSDIAFLKEKRKEGPLQVGWIYLWDMFSIIFLLIFINSAGGRTLLTERQFLELAEINQCVRWVYFTSLGLLFIITLLIVVMEIKRGVLKKKNVMTSPRPFTRRDPVSLYNGGGIYIDSEGEPQNFHGLIKMHIFNILYAHIFYWNWSVASLVLMHCFILSAVVYEIFRMVFVYIHHKRAFG